VEYAYPTYEIDITPQMMERCCDIAVRLLEEVGFLAAHDEFLDQVRDKPGLRVDGHRVYYAPQLVREYIDEFIARHTPTPEQLAQQAQPETEWGVSIAGYSMCTLDLETDEVRDATRQDLRDYIKLANSFEVGGAYPVMPQDVPPLMRTLACFKICWESSQTIGPYDYQQPEQLPYLYEMHQVMGRTLDLMLTVTSTLTIDPKDLELFLRFLPHFRRNGDIYFRILDYAMLGITKPITAPGCATMQLANMLGVQIIVNQIAPEVWGQMPITAGRPTDLRNACWAFGSPRRHLHDYLATRILAALCGYEPPRYAPSGILLETSSPAVDEQAALEKMAAGLLGALQGSRTFGYAGVLCVDDVFSPVQFVIDIEMVEYIRELIEAFAPHPDVIAMDGLYEECLSVGRGEDTFISHPNTARRLRNVLPSSDRIVREKLRSWMSHRTILKDRARREARERIASFEPYQLPADQQAELDRIYAEAEAELR